MSINIDYFFNSELNLSDLAFEISRRLGCQLSRVPDGDMDVCSGGLFGIDLTLWGGHTLVNDLGIPFEDYRYVIGNKTWAGSPLRPIQLEVIALVAYFLHDTRLAIHRGMLVYETQILLTRYEPREDGWYDLVGDKRVTYPDHLVDIKARIPDPGGAGLIA